MEEDKKQTAVIEFRDAPLIVYKDFASYQLGSGFFGIITKNDGMDIYPSDLIRKISITEQE